MLSHLNPGDAVQLLDLQLAVAPFNGNSIAEGVEPSRTSELETGAGSGLAFVDGDPVTVASDAVAHNAGDTLPRRDLLYIDSDGVLQLDEGEPNEPRGPEGVIFEDDPFKFSSPAPTPLDEIDGVPIAEVAIPRAALDYDPDIHFRDIRPTTAAIFDDLTAHSQFQCPVYDELSEADETPRSLVQITGDGMDDRGLYNYFEGHGWERIGEQTTLDDLIINSDMDWQEYAIRNIGPLHASSLSLDDGHGDINRLPTIKYAENVNEEIARISLDADQALEIGYLEVKMKGGGTNPDFTIDYYDENTNEIIVETSDKFRAAGNANAVSSAGADVIMRYTNETGDVAHVSINEITRIVDADEV